MNTNFIRFLKKVIKSKYEQDKKTFSGISTEDVKGENIMIDKENTLKLILECIEGLKELYNADGLSERQLEVISENANKAQTDYDFIKNLLPVYDFSNKESLLSGKEDTETLSNYFEKYSKLKEIIADTLEKLRKDRKASEKKATAKPAAAESKADEDFPKIKEATILVQRVIVKAKKLLDSKEYSISDEDIKSLESLLERANKDLECVTEFCKSMQITMVDGKKQYVIIENNDLLDPIIKDYKELEPHLDEVLANSKKEPRRVPVERVEEADERTAKNGSKFWDRMKKMLICAGLSAAILVSANNGILLVDKFKGNERKNNDNNITVEDTITTPAPSPTPTAEIIDDSLECKFANLNINDNAALLAYANELAVLLPQEYQITVEDIAKAIRLGNYDLLDDKSGFASREDVYYITNVLGIIIDASSSDAVIERDINSDIYVQESQLTTIFSNVTDGSVTISDFDAAKTDKGYDVYKLVEIAANNMYINDPNKAFNYAKLLNEFMAEKVIDFHLCQDAPVSTYFTLLGYNNSHLTKSQELTAGKNLSTIYGAGTENDGTYGYICKEEIDKFLAIGCQDNMIYTDVIDQNILVNNNTLTK